MTRVISLRSEEKKLKNSSSESSNRADTTSDLAVLEELVEQQSRELEQAQNRLRLSERMAALGNLSAGLAHDMGNLLLPIRVRLDALEERGLGPEARQDLDAVRESVQQLQRLANGLRLFSLDPNQGNRGESTALGEWWLDVEPFFRHALGRGARIEAKFQPDLPAVRIARHRVTQAVYYLLQNARDAAVSVGDLGVTVSAQHEGEWVALCIKDNGRGMAAEVQDRCLEPYFTTKTRATCTGLGLSLVHGIVEKAGGTIDVSSAEGTGTTITLRLKPAEATNRAESALGNALVSLQDARVRSYLSGVLRAHGYVLSTEARLPAVGESLWVSDSSPGFEHLLEFARQPGKWVIWLGGDAAAAAHTERVISIPSSPKPSVFREALESIPEEPSANEERS